MRPCQKDPLPCHDRHRCYTTHCCFGRKGGGVVEKEEKEGKGGKGWERVEKGGEKEGKGGKRWEKEGERREKDERQGAGASE
jgi:hypothetical protein